MPEVTIIGKHKNNSNFNYAWNIAAAAAAIAVDRTIIKPIDYLGAAHDFFRNYYDMRTANWQESDKYFHAKANFQAAQRGPWGEEFATHFSNLREIFDQRVKGDSRQAAMSDQKANLYGRTQAKYYNRHDFKKALQKYRYTLTGLPNKY